MTPLMWMEAMQAREPELVCPACDEENSPNAATNAIHVLDSHGRTGCDTCGHVDQVQMFVREFAPKEK